MEIKEKIKEIQEVVDQWSGYWIDSTTAMNTIHAILKRKYMAGTLNITVKNDNEQKEIFQGTGLLKFK